MTKFLVTEENPTGYKLEEILAVIRKDIILRATRILDDDRAQARHVLENNIKILNMLTECIHLAEDSTKTLDHAFGPHKDGEPRIGV
ncbi:MAG: hypothetical protein ACFCUQ_10600 [Kiloniellales bacterium]